MEDFLEELHNDYVSSTEYNPRIHDIEYDWWVANAARPYTIEWEDLFNEDCK